MHLDGHTERLQLLLLSGTHPGSLQATQHARQFIAMLNHYRVVDETDVHLAREIYVVVCRPLRITCFRECFVEAVKVEGVKNRFD
ncbi:hypothetical protein D3C72_1916030 [compost metagenome]